MHAERWIRDCAIMVEMGCTAFFRRRTGPGPLGIPVFALTRVLTEAVAIIGGRHLAWRTSQRSDPGGFFCFAQAVLRFGLLHLAPIQIRDARSPFFTVDACSKDLIPSFGRVL